MARKKDYNREAHDGTILKMKNRDLFLGKIQVGFKTDGKPLRKSVYGKSRTEVSEKLMAIAFNHGVGKCYDPSIMTLKEWINFWLENFKKLSLKVKTFEVYEININNHIVPSLGHITLKNLDTMHIQKFINDKYNSGLATGTIIKLRNILSGCLKQAYKNDMIIKNPIDNVTLPRHTQKEIKAFTPEEQNRFEENAKKDSLEVLFIIALDTGLRIGELLALTWKDVNLDKGIVSINKNLISVKDYDNEGSSKYILKVQNSPKTRSSIRQVPLPIRTIAFLKQYKQVSNSITIFCTKKGKYLSPKNVNRSFKRIVEKAKIDVCSFHTLRHTYATRLFELGVKPKVVSEFLGHARVGITLDIYVNCNPSIKNEAVKILDNYHANANAL